MAKTVYHLESIDLRLAADPEVEEHKRRQNAVEAALGVIRSLAGGGEIASAAKEMKNLSKYADLIQDALETEG